MIGRRMCKNYTENCTLKVLLKDVGQSVGYVVIITRICIAPLKSESIRELYRTFALMRNSVRNTHDPGTIKIDTRVFLS